MISRRIWRVGNRLCVCLLRLILSTCLTATLAPFLYIAIPLLSIFEHFALQILLLCVICGVAALFYRKWISVGLAATMAVWSLFGAASTLMSSTEDQNSRATASENIKLLSLNMWERNTAYGQTLQYLEESHADVIGLVEVTPTWAVALHALDKRYPFRIDCPQSLPNCGTLLLSKYPFRHSYSGLANNALPAIAWGEIDWAGHEITILETHLSWPFAP
ncbi:MAG TPA: endonuclease/exonuclease/phosphatase family protein, partial [Dongiaceae bacterium]